MDVGSLAAPSRLFRVRLVSVPQAKRDGYRGTQGSPATDFQVTATSIGCHRVLASGGPSSVLCAPPVVGFFPHSPITRRFFSHSPQCFNFSYWLRRQDGETVAAGLHRWPCRSPSDRPLIVRIAVYYNCRVCHLFFSRLLCAPRLHGDLQIYRCTKLVRMTHLPTILDLSDSSDVELLLWADYTVEQWRRDEKSLRNEG